MVGGGGALVWNMGFLSVNMVEEECKQRACS